MRTIWLRGDNLQGPFPVPVGRGNRKRGRMHYRNAVFRNLEFPGREIKREEGTEISNVHT